MERARHRSIRSLMNTAGTAVTCRSCNVVSVPAKYKRPSSSLIPWHDR